MGTYLDADYFNELGPVASDLCRLPGLIQRLLLKLDASETDTDGEFGNVWASLTPLLGAGQPIGTIWPYFGRVAPTDWMLLDGSYLSMTAYRPLLQHFIDTTNYDGITVDALTGFNTANRIAVTADAASNKLLATGHGLQNNTVVMLTTTGTLPAPLAWNTIYYVVNASANDFMLSTTQGGTAIDLTDAGSGTHYLNLEFALPDFRGRSLAGADNMGGASKNLVTSAEADKIGGAVGAETHMLTENEMPAHTHRQVAHNSASLGGASNAGSSATANLFSSVDYTLSAGGGAAHNNMQPTAFVSYIIYTGASL